jgi:hypothetical protein
VLIKADPETNQSLLFFILDAGEEFCSQPGDCLRLVEGHLFVNLSALEMAWLTTRLKDWFDVCLKVRLRDFARREAGGGQNRRERTWRLKSSSTP